MNARIEHTFNDIIYRAIELRFIYFVLVYIQNVRLNLLLSYNEAETLLTKL